MTSPFIEMIADGNPHILRAALIRIHRVIADSFTQDGSRITQAETRRRFKIVEDTMRELRREHGWAMVRIYDELPVALRAKLDGHPWNPQDNRIWSPQ